MANLKYIGKNILNHDLILKKGDVSGSNASTGSFGNINISKNASITGDMVVGGRLTAQEIHTEIESASIIFTSGSTKFGDTSDDTHEFTGSILVKGDLTAENLTADSSSFSTRVTNLKSDSGSFSTRVTNLVSDSASFSTRITTAETELELTLISGSAQIATQISGAFDSVSSSLSDRLQTAEAELELTLISGSAQLASQISGAFTDGFEFDGTISGSATSTGSFGRVKVADNMGIGVNSAHVGAGLTIKGTGASSADHGLRIAGDTGTLIVEGGSQSGISVIHGAAGGFWRMMSDGELEFGHHDNFNVGFYTNNTKRMVLNSGGNFSIGNTNNTHKLDVSGTGRFSDTLEVTSGNISGSATSTGSFGAVTIDGSKNIHGNSNGIGIFTDAIDGSGVTLAPDGTKSSTSLTNNYGLGITHTGTHGSYSALQINTGVGKVLWVGNDAKIGIKNSDPVTELDVRGTISGSIIRSAGTTNLMGNVSIGSATTSGTGLTIIPDGTASGTSLENNFGLAITHNGTNTSHYALQVNTGTGALLRVNNGGIVDFPSATKISGSSTSTGSFGLVLQNGSELSTFLGAAGTETLFSGSAASTGSFGRVEADSGSFDVLDTSGKITSAGGVTVTGTSKLQAFRTSGQFIEIYPDGNGSNYLQAQGNIRFAPNLGTKMILHANGRLGINTTTDAGFQMDVNGTGRFSDTLQGTHFSGSQFTGIFNGALSGSAQIASNISGAFAVASASFAADILSNSSSFAARDTLSEATSSKILNGELEFTNITGSGHISMSLSSTGSFGRVSATTIGGHSPLTVDSKTTFTNSITSSAHVSSSMTSTASFARVNVIALGGHEALTIDPITTFTNVITASAQVEFDDKIFIQTGSFKGNLHVGTNADIMRIGKSTSGLIVSGSEQISRFATGSDGSIIDLGFTVTNEDGNVVLAGDGDGIHVDSNNYWYNNKYYKVGDGVNNFLNYDTQDGIRYKGELTVQTGSFGGEMFINSPTGSMFIGKFTGGIPSSGSDNVSRFATGSDGSIIDLGFTTTDESGETVFLTTGDGIVRDDKNYWYTTGHFKVGDGQKQIEWNTTDLNISASTVDVTTLKASDVNFAGLPTSDPLITGSLWVSGSATSGSFKSGYVMISGIHG